MMNIFNLINKEPFRVKFHLLVMLLIATGSQILLLLIIHTVLENIAANVSSGRYLVMFLIMVLLHIVSINQLRKIIIQIIENLAMTLLEQSIENVRHAPFEPYERIGATAIYNTITIDTYQISKLAHKVVPVVLNASIIILGCLFYLLWLSLTAFAITMGVIVCGVFMYAFSFDRLSSWLRQSREKERELIAAVKHLIYGFKELKLHDEKNDDFFFNHFKQIITMYKEIRVQFRYALVNADIFSTLIEYFRFIPIVFLLPVINEVPGYTLVKIVTVIIFLPFHNVREAIPEFLKTKIAIERLSRLSHKLETLDHDHLPLPSEQHKRHFTSLTYTNMAFSYTDQEGNPLFTLGPLNLSINAGEVVFVIGGNGSGKTTLLKLITGLYTPWSGSIQLDGVDINIAQYRYLFSVIFTDFHLFDRFYGLKKMDPDHVNELLRLMKLDQKLIFTDGQFHTRARSSERLKRLGLGFSAIGAEHKATFLEGQFSPHYLSTGQQKRLALITSLLEDKTIYVFDEWAAGQDPEFREYFYLTLLPEFKYQGKTIINVTHDDQYFHVANRIVKLEYGQIGDV